MASEISLHKQPRPQPTILTQYDKIPRLVHLHLNLILPLTLLTVKLHLNLTAPQVRIHLQQLKVPGSLLALTPQTLIIDPFQLRTRQNLIRLDQQLRALCVNLPFGGGFFVLSGFTGNGTCRGGFVGCAGGRRL